MKKLSIAYFGTPYFSANLLEKILSDPSVNQLTKVAFIVTQPDKTVGKKQIMTKSPVKIVAEKHCIPVYDSVHEVGHKIKNVDFALVFAYGFKQLIPREILKSTRLKFKNTNSGFINIHPSLLPKYRGASPIAYPLILGDNKTGVTLFVMDEKMDHGPIIAQEEMEILPTEKRSDLEIKLTDLGFDLLRQVIKGADICFEPIAWVPFQGEAGEKHGIKPFIEQDHSLATHARYLTKNDGFILLSTLTKSLKNEPLTFEELPNIVREYLRKYQKSNIKYLKNSSKIIYDLFRGLHPWPGIWTIIRVNPRNNPRLSASINLKRLKITNLQYQDEKLTILRVQLEGKKEVDLKTFEKVYAVFR